MQPIIATFFELSSQPSHRWPRLFSPLGSHKNGLVARPVQLEVTMSRCSTPYCDGLQRGLKKYNSKDGPLCKTCYQRRLRAGIEPFGKYRLEKSKNWKGEAVTYKGMHERVTRTRGPAHCLPCRLCKKTATDWALHPKAHDTHYKPQGNRESVYSTNVLEYIPLCRKCHCKLDTYAPPLQLFNENTANMLPIVSDIGRDYRQQLIEDLGPIDSEREDNV